MSQAFINTYTPLVQDAWDDLTQEDQNYYTANPLEAIQWLMNEFEEAWQEIQPSEETVKKLCDYALSGLFSFGLTKLGEAILDA